MTEIVTNVPQEALQPYRPPQRAPGVQPTKAPGRRAGDCEPDCCCVQCTMRTLTRPRYFAGQLLSDVDLRDEQAYQIAKTRLHNRYLHGFGVVCGLQVTCDGCDERSVVIKPGYALGPCGEDILVPCAESLDVIAAIEACRRRPVDCDPLVRRPADIDRAEAHWCITLAYDELEVTPKAALRPPGRSTCGCSEGRGCRGSGDCGCGGAKGSGGCGCGGRSSGGCACGGKNGNGNGGSHKGTCGCGTGCSCGPVPARVYEPGKGLSCEPTRVRETYRLGVVERACATCDTSLRESELFRAGREVSGALGLAAQRMGTANVMALAMYAFVSYDKLPEQYRNPTNVTTTLVAAKRGVWDLYSDNPLGIPCPDLATIKAVEVLDPPGDTAVAGQDVVSSQWQATQQRAALNLATLTLRYLWEWFCYKLQPPCPPDPCDDRLIIACVTVRDGRVVRVCNFSCRKRAGSFTARDYWLSLFGIKPLVLMLLERLCCGDLVSARSPIRNRLADLLQVVDPAGDLRASIARDDFARVRRVAQDFASVRASLDLERVLGVVRSVVAPDERTDFVTKLDQPLPEVERDLQEAGVAHTVREVDEAPPLAAVRAAALAGADDVVLLRHAATGRLAGVERAHREPEEAGAQRRVDELSNEVTALRSELATLRRQGTATRAAAGTGGAPAAKKTTTAKKATAKKATAKKQAQATKKATAKKQAQTTKKATAKKATRKRTSPRGGGS